MSHPRIDSETPACSLFVPIKGLQQNRITKLQAVRSRAPYFRAPSIYKASMDIFNTFQSEELSGQQIRATSENPRRVSVFDAIKVITGETAVRFLLREREDLKSELLMSL